MWPGITAVRLLAQEHHVKSLHAVAQVNEYFGILHYCLIHVELLVLDHYGVASASTMHDARQKSLTVGEQMLSRYRVKAAEPDFHVSQKTQKNMEILPVALFCESDAA